ncbi:hypothetical protein ACO0QE_001527 [Hanseniaspora vineae]
MSGAQKPANGVQDENKKENVAMNDLIGIALAEGESDAAVISTSQEMQANDNDAASISDVVSNSNTASNNVAVFSSNLTSQVSKIYISNVPYDATEDKLLQLFAPYGCYEVLVPAQTVRGFRRSYMRSFGIAYADFQTLEKAKDCVAKMNNTVFESRNLVLKLYEPFAPNGNRDVHKKKKKVQDNEIDQQNNVFDLANGENSANALQQSPNAKEASKKQKSKRGHKNKTAAYEALSTEHSNSSENISVSKQEVSETTVYVTNLHRKVTDVDLSDLFHEFHPVDIYTFYKKYHSKGLHIRIWVYAALVEFAPTLNDQYIRNSNEQKGEAADVSDYTTGNVDGNAITEKTNIAIEVSKKFNSLKLKGKNICVRPAYLSKIKEVQNADKKNKGEPFNENIDTSGDEVEHVVEEGLDEG